MNVQELFEKYEDEYHKFDLVQNKLSQRADLHAFLLLDLIVPGKCDIVSSAEHDEIWLGVSLEELESATEEQILELIRCGVRLDSSNDALAMFV